MDPILSKIETDHLQRAVHGVAGLVVVAGNPDIDGIAVVTYAFNRRSGSILGELDSFGGWAWDPKEMIWHLAQAEVLVAYDAPKVKAQLVKLVPMVERKPWVCTKTQVSWPADVLKEMSLRLEFPPAVPIDLVVAARVAVAQLGQNSKQSGLPYFEEALRRAIP